VVQVFHHRDMAPERLSTRKRHRSQISDGADELSPLPASTPTSAAKRRKVETPTSRLAGLSSRFRGLVGLGSKHHNTSADELGDEKDIYDFKVTDDEDETTNTPKTTKSKPSARKPQVQKSAASEAAPTPKRSVGRPRKKKDGLEQVKALSRQALDKGATATAKAEHPPSSEDEVEHTGTPTKPGSSRATKITSNKSSPALGTQSAGKPESHRASNTLKRGRPKKLHEGLRDSDTVLPRGILTPSKSKNQSTRKTVAFEQSPVGELEGFKDIPVSFMFVRRRFTSSLDRLALSYSSSCKSILTLSSPSPRSKTQRPKRHQIQRPIKMTKIPRVKYVESSTRNLRTKFFSATVVLLQYIRNATVYPKFQMGTGFARNVCVLDKRNRKPKKTP
jgi:hypothetical protein